MSQPVASTQHQDNSTQYALWGIIAFIVIAVVGLFYVKWFPYYGKAMHAAASHSIGGSILTADGGMTASPSWQAAWGYALSYGASIWQALVLGLLLGSAVQVLIPRAWVSRLLGDAGYGGVVRGGILAIPSMMCTCCSAPVIRGLRQANAGPGGAVAYWLGNTMLNPATLVFMGFVLGWHWAGLRVAVGIVMVFGLGWVVRRLSRQEACRETAVPLPDETLAQKGTLLMRWLRTLGAMTLRLVPEYAVIVLLLGAARGWLFPSMGLEVDNTLLWIVGLAIAGTLFVIPTAGEVPIVQAALALGMATGPAAALLVTLPPVSLPSLAMVAKSFRLRELLALVVGVALLGVVTAGVAILLGF